MKPLAFYSSLISVIFVFASCHKEGKSIVTPVSSGRPYEVLVVADDQCWNSPDSALFHVLDTDVPGLPQPERSFRISRVRPESFNRSTRLFRNIIIADIQDIYTQTKFKYTRDAYASPQMIMTIQSPSQEEFAEYVSRHGQVIIDFFTRAEMNREVKLLKKKHNEALSAKVQSLFDCDIWMPVELASYKVGQQFLWASSNLNDLNFVIYTYPYASKETFTKAYFIEKRDSVMKANLPGAKEGMNIELDKAFRLDDFITMGQLIAYDALNREESCGGHFREEHQTEEGEAKRDDENFFYVACWEYQGSDDKAPVLYKEPLVYEAIKVQTRNYKS